MLFKLDNDQIAVVFIVSLVCKRGTSIAIHRIFSLRNQAKLLMPSPALEEVSCTRIAAGKSHQAPSNSQRSMETSSSSSICALRVASFMARVLSMA